MQRGAMSGYTAAGTVHDESYGSATYVRSDSDNRSQVKRRSPGSIFIIETVGSNRGVVRVFKRPCIQWREQARREAKYPTLLMGDPNSHRNVWG